VIIIIFQLRTAALRLIVRSWLDVPTFNTRRLHACHHARTPSGGRWNYGRLFCLNAEFHVTFRDLLQAVKLRHGADGFTSPPKKGVLRIFSSKNSTASAGFEPANLGTKGQHATSRPPKPLCLCDGVSFCHEFCASFKGTPLEILLRNKEFPCYKFIYESLLKIPTPENQ
jgi:hypothetical protein